MGTTGKSVTQTLEGLGDEWIITDHRKYKGIEDSYKKELEANARYIELLRENGFFGSEEQLEEYFSNRYDWKATKRLIADMEKGIIASDGSGWYKPFDTAEEYLASTVRDGHPFVTSFEEYKRAQFLAGRTNSVVVPGTMSEAMDVYYRGANPSGYGRGNDARKKWDEQYGFSDWLDNHPNLKLNTNSVMYRGLRLSDGSIKQLYKQAANGGEMDFIGPSSWSVSEGVAESFTKYSLVGKRNQNLVIFENVTKGKHNATPFIHGFDAEVLYSGKQSFKVLGIRTDEKGVYHVKVEEV